MSDERLIHERLLEDAEAKTAGLTLALGHEAGIEGKNLELIVNFMAQRFPGKASEAYIIEWLIRFVSGTEWLNADGHSKRVLLSLSREMNLHCYPDPYEGFT